MAIPDSHKKERLHSAYIRAVIAHAEQSFVPESEGDYGIDGCIRKIELHETEGKKKYIASSPIFTFQLKATKNCKINNNGEVVFSLDSDAHLRFTKHVDGIIPAVLIVYDTPNDINECVFQDNEKLSMMGCCYWKFMDKETLKKRTVYIPQTQIFDANAVNEILELYGRELRNLRNVSSD